MTNDDKKKRYRPAIYHCHECICACKLRAWLKPKKCPVFGDITPIWVNINEERNKFDEE